MSIQSSINQSLSVAALLFSQTPYAEAKRQEAASLAKEKRLTKETQERYSKALKVEETAAEEVSKKGASEAAFKVYEKAMETGTKAAEDLFIQNPNEQTAKQLRLSYEGMDEYYAAKAEDAIKAEQNRLARSRSLEGTYTDTEANKNGK